VLRGIYLSASGMTVSKEQLEIAAHNITNVNTPGYRAQQTSVEEFGREILHRLEGGFGTTIGTLGRGPVTNDPEVKAVSAPTRVTGRPLDIALNGEDFFISLQTTTGTAFSRGGSLFLSADGYLLDRNGHRVLGQNGPIRIPSDLPAAAVKINTRGEVLAGEELVDRLALVRIDPQTLGWTEEGLLTTAPANVIPLKASEEAVAVGVLEGSNVDLVREMTELLRLARLYQLNQQTLKVQDTAVKQLTSGVGEGT